MADDSLNTPEGARVTKELKQEMLSPDARGMSVAQLMGFSDEEVNATYAKACQAVASNDLGNAGKLFATLVALRHNEGRYWRGLALVAQRAGQHKPADFFYSAAIKRSPEDVISYVFRAEARVNLGRQAAARSDALQAIEIGERTNAAEDRSYVQRAKKLLQMLDVGEANVEFETK